MSDLKWLGSLSLGKSDVVLRRALEAVQGLSAMSSFSASDWEQIVTAVENVFLKHTGNPKSGIHELAGETLEVVRDADQKIVPVSQKKRAGKILTGAEGKVTDPLEFAAS